jgi:hypothetical protein
MEALSSGVLATSLRVENGALDSKRMDNEL